MLNEWAQKRIIVVVGFFAIGFLGMLIRGIQLNLLDNKKLEQLALKQYQTAVRLAAMRNRVLDAKGQELAVSVPVGSLYADPKLVDDPLRTVTVLGGILGLNSKELLKKFQEPRRFVWVKRQATDEEIAAVEQQHLSGIFRLKESRRFYPHGSLAAPVLGAVGVDAEALGGIELAYDDYLMLRQPEPIYQRDAKGRLYLSPDHMMASTKSGDLYLTIDKHLQFIAESVLEKTVSHWNAKGGVVVVMDPQTGAVLALANAPTFNPNQYQKYPLKYWRNRAVADVFEPGSIFKPIVAAVLLEKGLIKPEDRLNCENGTFTLSSETILNDSKPHGSLSFSEVIKVSSNIGMFKAVQRISPGDLFQQLGEFGFGKKTGIDFPGESGGLVRSVKGLSPIEFGTVSFGQGIGVTALQMTAAFAALANGGFKMRPYLVSHIVDGEGLVLYRSTPVVERQPIAKQTAQIVTQILIQAVKEGTGKEAALTDYVVAGKTGTAQKIDAATGRYAEGKYLPSFIGFAPAEEPKLVVLVLLDEPTPEYYGGVVTAPAFKEIMARSLSYLSVPLKTKQNWAEKQEAEAPTEDRPAMQRGSFAEQTGKLKVPSFLGASMREVLQQTGEMPVDLKLFGSGFAAKQIPPPESLIDKGQTVYVYFSPDR